MRYKEITEATWDSPETDIGRAVPRTTGNIRGATSLADIRSSERRRAAQAATATAGNSGAATNTGVGNGTAASNPALPGNGPTDIRSSNALFTMDGSQSSMTAPDAGEIMQSDTLPRFRRMQASFGKHITINDAIAKRGTSRESNTQRSQHFSGKGLDLSTRGMSNEEKLLLVAAAQAAGFTGFGFGNTILHVDTGPRRHWAYGNGTYGGVSVAQLGTQVRNNQSVV